MHPAELGDRLVIGIECAVDRDGTLWFRICDRFGERVYEICNPSDYWRLLKHRYWVGVLWRLFGENVYLPSDQILCASAVYSPGFARPLTVCLPTVSALSKNGSTELKPQFMPAML